MVINAKSIFDPQLMALFPTKPLVETLPGSADGLLSSVNLLLTTGLLGVILFSCDLARNSAWRRRIWVTMVATGACISVLGISQKFGSETILSWVWDETRRDPNNNFGMFRYRDNAAAFLNLCLPLAAGLTFMAFRNNEALWVRLLCVACVIVIALGIVANPSRLGWLMAGLILCCFGIQIVSRLWRRVDNSGTAKRIFGYGFGVLIASLVLVAFSFFGKSKGDWAGTKNLAGEPSEHSPTEIYTHMIPEAGWLGFGPGTFQVVFPRYQHSYNFGEKRAPESWTTHFWAHAHHDYLQTLIEWGYIGSGIWAVLIFGGLLVAVKRLVLTQHMESKSILFCSLLAMAAVLGQAFFDYPLQIASIQLYFSILLGICWSSSEAGELDTAFPE
ncbi:MAG TPA: O-antigen ligase family protein [Candidatus Saccharimonadales bacterium]|nr:O-antigen ligase family protein [Candidatus Saccharimonadales bacterium]